MLINRQPKATDGYFKVNEDFIAKISPFTLLRITDETHSALLNYTNNMK